MLRLVPRARLRFEPLKFFKRGFHDVTATLVKLGDNGQCVTTQHTITVGEPNQAYVLIPVEVGRAFAAVAAAGMQQSSGFGLGARNWEIKRPLWFFHETRHFAHGMKGLLLLLRSLLTNLGLQSRVPAFHG